MIIAKNNEEKRSQIWRIVTAVSTVLIILIFTFFVIKLFTANPLEGTWIYEDSDLKMTVKSGGTAEIEWSEQFEDTDVKVEMEYSVDKETKTFSLKANTANIEKAAAATDGVVTADGLASMTGTLEGTYNYSVENNQLTLTDREYGEQMVFDKE